MKILAIDTATEACSAALYVDAGDDAGDTDTKGESITSRYQIAPRQHSRLILKMIDELLADALLNIDEIDAIAFGRGPGSFMGLRIAAGVVQGIAFAHDIPVIPVSTLKVIAQCAYDETQNKNVLVAIDARMDEVYTAVYCFDDSQRWQLKGEEQVITPDKVVLPELKDRSEQPVCSSVGTGWTGAGTGWASYSDKLLPIEGCRPQTILPDCLPSAKAMVSLAAEEFRQGNTVPAAEAVPVYIRNDVAKKPKPVTL